MNVNLNYDNITLQIDFAKNIFIALCTLYMFLKITNIKIGSNKRLIIGILVVIIISGCVTLIRYKVNFFVSRIFFVFLLSVLFSNITINNLFNSILGTIIALSTNYIILFSGIIFTFIINVISPIQDDYINLIIMMCIQLIILYRISKIKRLKNGIDYITKKAKKDDYLDIILLNVSTIIFFSFIIFANIDWYSDVARSLFIGFITFIIIMFITIQKSIQLYYKQKLMIKELTETKSDLENAKQEIQTLEKENIELSKKNHSFKHQYKSLKHKVDEIIAGNKANEETDLNKQLDNLSKDIYVAPKNIELTETGIIEIDDMLRCMKSECDENNINFHLQIIGNIYYMINNIISKEELEILLADHIKDAIIAINHGDNVNKSILVKLGKIEDFYGLYIYDSGIEFEKETLDNLGKKLITTHSDEGGTGMGFMNTFDTLKKNNASLTINQIGKPSKDNFTKVLEFRFDGKNEFKVLDAEG